MPAAGADGSDSAPAPTLPGWAPRCQSCIRRRDRCDRNAEQLVCSSCVKRSIPCVPGPTPPNAETLVVRGFGPPIVRSGKLQVDSADAPSSRLRRRSEPIVGTAAAPSSSGPAKKASPAGKGKGKAGAAAKVITYGAKSVGSASASRAAPASNGKSKSAGKGPPLRRVSAPIPKSKPVSDPAVDAAPVEEPSPLKSPHKASKKAAADSVGRVAAQPAQLPPRAAVAPPSPVRARSPVKPKAKPKPRPSTTARARPAAVVPTTDALADFIAAHIDQDTAPYLDALAAAGVSSADQIVALSPSELAELVAQDEVRDNLSALQRVMLRSRATPHLAGEEL